MKMDWVVRAQDWVRVGVCALLLVATGCGGGGGGGGGSNGPQLTFSADKTAITLNYPEGTQPTSDSVTITAAGTFTGTLYVGAQVEGQGVSNTIPATISGNQAVFQISGRSGLAVGEYTGRVLLQACSDPNCTRQIGNSPIAVAYTVRVLARLRATPAQVNLTAISGTTASQQISIQLPSGVTSSTASVFSGGPWLTVSNTSPTAITVNAASLPSGSYSGSVSVTAGVESTSIPVSYVVSAPAGGDRNLAVNPTSVTLAAVEGAQGAAVALGVTPPSWGSQVSTSITYGGSAQNWLSLTPTTGGYQVSGNATDLRAGTYTATIRVQGAYPSAPLDVPVALTVGLGLVEPASRRIVLDTETTAAALSGSVPINVVTGPSTTWTATPSTAWLVLSNPMGTTGESLSYSLNTALIDALANDAIHTAQVTIVPGRTTMSPVTFSVQLEKRLAQITSVGPYVHAAGQPIRVVLRGSGFDGVANLSTRVTLENGSINRITRLNDRAIVIQAGALSAGTHTIRVSNTLGLTAASSRITTVVPPAFAAAQVPTGGSLRSLVFDAERNAIYAANLNLESVMRFRFAGGTWQTDSVPLAAAYDVGLTQDGARLLAATNNLSPRASSIRLLDPADLSTVSTTQLSNGLEPTFTDLGFGLQTTNDGRTWLAIGNQFSTMTAFRASDASLTPFIPGFQTTFFGGPWFAMSRDGERLIVTQSASVTPTPPMLFMDASESVLRPNPAGLTFSYRFAVSEDGNRVLFDASEVRDRDFNLIGRIALPQPQGQPPYIVRAAQISHDGTRAYVMAYREDFSSAGLMPRVFVFDSSTRQTTQEFLPALGYFDLPAFPTCTESFSTPGSCVYSSVASAISLDSRTLFFASDVRMVVQPIPNVLTPIAAIPSAPAKQTVSPGATVPWRLELRQ